jgi:hypothetical protein
MRTVFGIRFLSIEINVLEQINTKVVAIPIPMPLMAEVVTANEGQSPNTKIKTGFSLMIPLVMRFSLFIIFLLF